MTRYTIADIERIAAEYPNLYAKGFSDVQSTRDVLSDKFLCQVNACAQFVEHCCEPTKTFRRRERSSYGWKHLAELVLGQYVCNGAFIVAALLAGYRLERDAACSPPTTGVNWHPYSERATPNAVFNMRVSSPSVRAFVDGGSHRDRVPVIAGVNS